MIAAGMDLRPRGKFGPIEDAHVHEPAPGPNTGDVHCRTCGVPLSRVDFDIKTGYGGIAASVEGVVKIEGDLRPSSGSRFDRSMNRHDRRAEKAKKRRKSPRGD